MDCVAVMDLSCSIESIQFRRSWCVERVTDAHLERPFINHIYDIMIQELIQTELYLILCRRTNVLCSRYCAADRHTPGGNISANCCSWLCFRSNFNFFYRIWKMGRFSVLVFGPKSVSYERSRSINRCILRGISARAFL